jgi:hypothetical protein
MKKILIALCLFSTLMSFTTTTKESNPFFRHIDITLTSSGGCSFHVVGEASISIFHGLTGFQGTITLGGPGSCPHGTYNVNYSSLSLEEQGYKEFTQTDDVSLRFDTNDVCAMSSVTITTTSLSQSTRDACTQFNSSDVSKSPFIDALREGQCR